MRGAPHRGFAVAIVLTSAATSVLTGGRPPRAGPKGRPSTRGSGGAASAGRWRGSRSRGAVSTRSRLWPARPRRGDQFCVVAAGSPFVCRRRVVGARPASRGRVAYGRRRGRGGAEAGEQHGSHRVEIFAIPEPQIKHLAAGRSIGEGQEGLDVQPWTAGEQGADMGTLVDAAAVPENDDVPARSWRSTARRNTATST
jgi:hypothetical protein